MSALRQFPRLVRNKFLAGLVIVIPIVITVKALWWLFSYVDGLALPLSHALLNLDRPIPGTGFALTIAVVLLAGFLLSSGPLRRLFDEVEEGIGHLPVAGPLYATIRKVLEGVGSPKSREAFKRFVLARLPGRTTPAFLTGSFTLRLADGGVRTLCTVYVPTNHLYIGDVVVLPPEDVIETDLTVEQGVSMMLSAGSAVPPEIRERGSRVKPV
jgi:uncharacterized membrane protein